MAKARIIEALGALAQENRLDIFRLLVQRGPGGVAAGDIGRRLEIAAPTLSFHLAQLRRAGLVKARRASRRIIYSANYRAMRELLAYLTENCCQGRVGACAPPAAQATAAAPVAAQAAARRHASG